jgi:hypothetical protein
MTNQGIIRDDKSKAILSNDSNALNKYKAERNQRRKIDSLERDVNEIQETLASMCERITKLENK